MKTTTTVEGNTCIIAIDGSIDTLTAPELEQAISEAPSCEKMIFDMQKVDYISSAGLRVVVTASRSFGNGNLTLKGMPKNVYEIFRMTGFIKFFNIE